MLRIFLVNPADHAFGVSMITPRWMYVLAASTPAAYGIPILCDELLDPFDPERLCPGDVIGIGIHTLNARRGYEVGRLAHARGAYVVYGGAHATLFPDEPLRHGGAHAVVTGDADRIWPRVLAHTAGEETEDPGVQRFTDRRGALPRNPSNLGKI